MLDMQCVMRMGATVLPIAAGAVHCRVVQRLGQVRVIGEAWCGHSLVTRGRLVVILDLEIGQREPVCEGGILYIKIKMTTHAIKMRRAYNNRETQPIAYA